MNFEKKVIELLTSIKTFQIAGLQIDKQKLAESKKQTKLLEEINGNNRRKRSWRHFFGIKHKFK